MIRGSHGWWGALGGLPQNGVVSYAISPFRQRAFKGFMSQDMSHMLGGATNELKYMLPGIPFPLIRCDLMCAGKAKLAITLNEV
ncbi:hypothetical protein BKA69DRAFT_1099044 [Paraphysoderma sedebokerense]|nr:hypothetical protein BKA69DRAFT_1099044 [Paraphysoderma sedebokerense]